jgi:hypothetical protein
MSSSILTLEPLNVRGTDSNSLLRLYDAATRIFSTSQLQMERARAEKAIRLIAKELKKRNVTL